MGWTIMLLLYVKPSYSHNVDPPEQVQWVRLLEAQQVTRFVRLYAFIPVAIFFVKTTQRCGGKGQNRFSEGHPNEKRLSVRLAEQSLFGAPTPTSS